MSVSPSKENILKKIRKALSNPVPLPFSLSEGTNDIFPPATDELAICFAEAFTQLQGRFVFCINEADMHQQLQTLITQQQWAKIFCNEAPWDTAYSNTIALDSCDAAITGCEALVARTGSIVLSTAQAGGRTASVYAPVHICIAYTHQLHFDIKDALQWLKEKYAGQLPSLVSFATGPSRTADIEKTLVTGVHGPKAVYVFMIESAG
jgi:L-lactate dehydrogenase complex protein LldG